MTRMSSRRRQMLIRKRRIVLSMMAGACIIFILIIIAIGSAVSSRRTAAQEAEEALRLAEEERIAEEERLAEEEAARIRIEDLPWYLRLINNDHPLGPDYSPADLQEVVPGHRVDGRILNNAQRMINDALSEGLHLHVVSSYRTYTEQKELFINQMWHWNSQGFNIFDAYHEAARSVAIPGSSEHQSGLALDIIAPNFSFFDEELVNTPEIQWLMANAWQYGFILRYPADAIHITGIIFEPWHWRYVGEEAAREIHQRGITLEEFLGVYPPDQD